MRGRGSQWSASMSIQVQVRYPFWLPRNTHGLKRQKRRSNAFLAANTSLAANTRSTRSRRLRASSSKGTSRWSPTKSRSWYEEPWTPWLSTRRTTSCCHHRLRCPACGRSGLRGVRPGGFRVDPSEPALMRILVCGGRTFDDYSQAGAAPPNQGAPAVTFPRIGLPAVCAADYLARTAPLPHRSLLSRRRPLRCRVSPCASHR
jgi:hypothetical protein